MPKALNKGELLNVVIALRNAMAALDSASFVFDGSLERISSVAENATADIRPTVQAAANGLYDVLTVLEELPEYQRLRRERLINDE